MDQSTCKAIVERHLPSLSDFFCLGHWSITPKFEHLDGMTAAQCWPDVDYESARIIFDPAKFDDEEEVINLIVHELTHLISAPFDLYANVAVAILSEDATAMASLRKVYAHATEMHVINVERIWRKTLARVYLDQVTCPAPEHDL